MGILAVLQMATLSHFVQLLSNRVYLFTAFGFIEEFHPERWVTERKFLSSTKNLDKHLLFGPVGDEICASRAQTLVDRWCNSWLQIQFQGL